MWSILLVVRHLGFVILEVFDITFGHLLRLTPKSSCSSNPLWASAFVSPMLADPGRPPTRMFSLSGPLHLLVLVPHQRLHGCASMVAILPGGFPCPCVLESVRPSFAMGLHTPSCWDKTRHSLSSGHGGVCYGWAPASQCSLAEHSPTQGHDTKSLNR